MKPKTVLITLVLAVILFTVTWWLAEKSSLPVHRPSSQPPNSIAAPVLHETAFPMIQDAANNLGRNPASPGANLVVLTELRSRLASLPREEAVAVIRSVLRSGLDAPTGLDLKPGPKGTLNSAPSLRVFLLDQLRALDPLAAREIARGILEKSTSPDEWALGLAISATDASPAGHEFLRDKSRQLATNQEWQGEPTAGFLEAFDVFVFNRDTEFTPQLASLLAQTNNRALAHAAFLTLDRLVLAEPAGTLGELLKNPALMQGREATRSGYFARADVRDAAQRAMLEGYLLSPGISASELERWAGTYPNANYMMSVNLLTSPGTPDGAEIAARDQAAFQMVNAWLADARFAGMKPALQSVRARLEKFVSPAK